MVLQLSAEGHYYLPKTKLTMYPSTDDILVVYQYIRNGIIFTTSNELIAAMRSEDGKYVRKKYFHYY